MLLGGELGLELLGAAEEAEGDGWHLLVRRGEDLYPQPTLACVRVGRERHRIPVFDAVQVKGTQGALVLLKALRGAIVEHRFGIEELAGQWHERRRQQHLRWVLPVASWTGSRERTAPGGLGLAGPACDRGARVRGGRSAA